MNYFFPLLGYLIGSIPFGLLISKLAGKDVREEGSKNIGATNVSRVLGKKLGILTLVCDCLKGILPMYFAAIIVSKSGTGEGEAIIACTGIAAVVGHMFPLYLKFRGGKGVATGLGVFLFLSPAAIAISLLIFIGSVALTGFVSVGSLLASGLIPLWIYLLGGTKTKIIAAAFVALLIWFKHHENIGRLLRGEEKTWKKSGS